MFIFASISEYSAGRVPDRRSEDFLNNSKQNNFKFKKLHIELVKVDITKISLMCYFRAITDSPIYYLSTLHDPVHPP